MPRHRFNDLNQVAWEMQAKAGARKFVESQTIPDISYADFAAGLGFESVEIHDPDEIRPLTWGLPGVGGGT